MVLFLPLFCLPSSPSFWFNFSLYCILPLFHLFLFSLSFVPLICPFLCLFFLDVGSVEGLAYHRGWDMLYWTSYTTSTITRHTVDQNRWGAADRHTVVTMSGDDHPRAFVLDECQRLDRLYILYLFEQNIVSLFMSNYFPHTHY